MQEDREKDVESRESKKVIIRSANEILPKLSIKEFDKLSKREQLLLWLKTTPVEDLLRFYDEAGIPLCENTRYRISVK